jgi:hypothetical protein
MNRSQFNKAIFWALGVFLSLNVHAQFYYGATQTFGKNRVQYNDFHWSWYRFERFDIYFYQDGKELAEFTSRVATKQLIELEKYLDFPIDDRLEIVLYNNMSDLKQTNIGLDDEPMYNTGGVTRIVGTKLFIYFDGDHNHLIEQIRAGIAEILIYNMIYGGNFREAMRSSTLIKLPEWYLSGLISFLSKPWSVEVDNRVRDGILSERYGHFNRLTGEEARFAGHALWNYIVTTYGKKIVPHILYMTVINRNVESGFLFVLGSSFDQISEDAIRFYTDRYKNLQSLRDDLQVLKKSSKTQVFSELKFSPNGNHLAYVCNDQGKYKILLYDLNKGSQKKIVRDGFRSNVNVDYSYPLLSWHPDGQILAVIYEEKGYNWLALYDLETKKADYRPLYQFNKVVDFKYGPDGRNLILSAVNNGQSDIYVYDVISNTFDQITNDIYDDIDPTFLAGTSGIIFSSNRLHDTLAVPDSLWAVGKDYDLFYYDLKERPETFRQLTNTPLKNETAARFYERGMIMYLSDQGGTQNRHLLKIDSTVAYVDTITHYRYFFETFQVTDNMFNIIEHDLNSFGEQSGQIQYKEGRYWLMLDDFQPSSELETFGGTVISRDDEERIPKSFELEYGVFEDETEPIEKEVDIDDYSFHPDLAEKYDFLNEERPAKEKKEDPDNVVQLDQLPSQKPDAKDFKLPRQRNFFPAFFPQSFTTQLDNSFLNHSYQTFTAGIPLFLNPSFNAVMGIDLMDLMENYRIYGAFRISVNLEDHEFYLAFKDYKKRLDKEILFHRRSQRSVLDDAYLIKSNIHEVGYSLSYPLSDVMRVKGTATYRNDQVIFLATNQLSLEQDPFVNHWGIIKAEWVYDNTISTGLNLYNGWRWKIFSEYYQNATELDQSMVTAGFDFRNYTKVHRSIIWANRLAGGTSMGGQKLIYYMGGIDNWLAPKFDQTTQIDYEQNYAFQTLATPLRGFDQNIRNGNSFMVLNSELRIPFFRYLSSRPIRSDFFENFQITGFLDVGTAWTGLHPWDESNFLNREEVTQGPITAIVYTQVEPIVAGYGIGARTRVLGYFLKADYAWGWVDGVVQDPRFYLSLGLDF